MIVDSDSEDNNEWEVEEILDSKLVRKTLKYLVRWVGYDELIWEPADLLKNSLTLVRYSTLRNQNLITYPEIPYH